MIDQPITATVSGSFRQAMGAVQDAVYRLTDAGVRVLSPADPRVVDRFGDFLFVASDMVRAIKLVQSRHLAAINASDFLWLVAPQGYVGRSGSMEIGFAVATGTPIFSSEVPTDLTLRQYVAPLASPEDAIRVVREQRAGTGGPAAADVLLEPVAAVDAAHSELERIRRELSRPDVRSGAAAAAAARRLDASVVAPLRDLR